MTDDRHSVYYESVTSDSFDKIRIASPTKSEGYTVSDRLTVNASKPLQASVTARPNLTTLGMSEADCEKMSDGIHNPGGFDADITLTPEGLLESTSQCSPGSRFEAHGASREDPSLTGRADTAWRSSSKSRAETELDPRPQASESGAQRVCQLPLDLTASSLPPLPDFVLAGDLLIHEVLNLVDNDHYNTRDSTAFSSCTSLPADKGITNSQDINSAQKDTQSEVDATIRLSDGGGPAQHHIPGHTFMSADVPDVPPSMFMPEWPCGGYGPRGDQTLDWLTEVDPVTKERIYKCSWSGCAPEVRTTRIPPKADGTAPAFLDRMRSFGHVRFCRQKYAEEAGIHVEDVYGVCRKSSEGLHPASGIQLSGLHNSDNCGRHGLRVRGALSSQLKFTEGSLIWARPSGKGHHVECSNRECQEIRYVDNIGRRIQIREGLNFPKALALHSGCVKKIIQQNETAKVPIDMKSIAGWCHRPMCRSKVFDPEGHLARSCSTMTGEGLAWSCEQGTRNMKKARARLSRRDGAEQDAIM